MENLKTDRRIILFSLPLIMLFCGCFSVIAGKDLSWDIANYHFYNPYAFLHHRFNWDIWPSTFICIYINPTIDFLTYFLIQHFSASFAEFILGALHGINYWLLFLIARLFLSDKLKNALAIPITLLGLYGPFSLLGIGSFQNDNTISIFILGFVYLYLRALNRYAKNHTLSWALFFFSGLLLGIGTGLKYIATLFIIGGLFATAILPIAYRKRVQLIAWLMGAITLGIFISAGYWMLLMWKQHHNPLFPFFNQLFQSPDYASINWRDTRYLPRNLTQFLIYPFYFSWDGSIADVPFRDFRFLTVYVLFLLGGIHWCWKKICHTPTQLDISIIWIYAFFISSYIVWQSYFSIARYIVSLEMLSPLIIYLLIRQILSHYYTRAIILIVIFSSLFFLMTPGRIFRLPINNASYFNVQLPPVVKRTKGAIVLLPYPSFVQAGNPAPLTYLIPFFPDKWHFIGIPFARGKFNLNWIREEKILALLKNSNSPVFLLTTTKSKLELYRAVHKWQLHTSGPCEIVRSDRQDLLEETIWLCPVRAGDST